MPSRTPGDEPDPAAELLGRWHAHHAATPESSADDEAPEEPPAPPATPAADERGPKHAAQRPPARPRRSARGSDQTEAGREIVVALGITPPDATPLSLAPPPEPAPRRPHPAVLAARGGDVEFVPRTLVRTLLGYLLLALVPATVVAGYLAYDDPETFRLAITGLLLFLVLVVYAVRVSAAPARLSIRSGQLEVVRGSHRDVFDLTSRFTRIEVVGRPGRPGWKVLFARFGKDPLVIDSSMVDPATFTAALERNRPQQRR